MDIMFPSNTSDFERGRVIAYRDSGLTYREIEEKTAVKQTTSRRLWDEWLELGKSTYTLPSGRPFMHEPKRRRGILATIETNRLTTFESLASQEGCSRSTIRKIAAEDRHGESSATTTRVPSTVSTFKRAHHPSDTTSSVLSARHLQTASMAPNTPNASYEGL